MDKNERLEELSDKVRKGIPIGFMEALEVIEYQENLKENLKKNKKKSFVHKVADWFKRTAVKNNNIPYIINNEMSVCEHEWVRTGDPDRQSCRCKKCNAYDG